MKSFPILSSLSHQKERDQISRRKKKTLKKHYTRERRIERRNKLSSSSLYFRTVTTCPSLSCMSLTGTPTPLPLRPTLLLLMTTLRKKERKKERRSIVSQNVFPFFFSFLLLFFLYGLGFVFIEGSVFRVHCVSGFECT